MAVYGYEGCEVIGGKVYVFRRGAGRLFVPLDVFPYAPNVSKSHWFTLLTRALETLPAPLPEWKALKFRPNLSASERMTYRWTALDHVEVWACNVLDAEQKHEEWVKDWLPAVGYVEPYEQMLTCVEFVNS